MSALLAGMNHAAAWELAALLNTLWYAGAVVGLTGSFCVVCLV